MSAMELWGAEYQENNALLIRPEHQDLFRAICERENMPFAFLGEVTGDGRVVVFDERDGDKQAPPLVPTPRTARAPREHAPSQLSCVQLPLGAGGRDG